jgi:hypothetical protein
MTTLVALFGTILTAGIVVLIGLQLRKPASSPVQDQTKEVARLEKELEVERRKLSEQEGKGKQLFASYKNLESDYKATQKECDNLKERITKFEARREQMEKEHRQMVEKMEVAQQALKEERQRVIREEEDMRKSAEEERDRIWAEHENDVIAHLTDMCKQPHFQFTSFTNKTLPDGFDGSLKPDFLIEFLDQYVIFDAKASKAQSLQTYIDDAVRKTADKIRKNPKIYPHVFLVVPTEAISELKKVVYPKDELRFFVVSREALAPILESLKRISHYELAEQLDPQKRENIVNIIAELATHISYRNAHELILTKMGADIIERATLLDPELAHEVEHKQSEKKLSQLSPSEIKRLVSSITEQNIAIQSLASPKAAVKKSTVKAAGEIISQKLL